MDVDRLMASFRAFVAKRREEERIKRDALPTVWARILRGVL